MARLNILPDERFSALHSALEERMAAVGRSILPENFEALCDPMVRHVLKQGLQQAGSDGGLVWLLDDSREYLVPAFGLGAASEKLVLKHQQPLREGIVSMVMASEQPFVENDVCHNSRHSKMVDEKLHQQTYAMIAIPLYFLRQCRGVISCVQVKGVDTDEPDPPGFSMEHMLVMQRCGAILTELIDYRLLRQSVQW